MAGFDFDKEERRAYQEPQTTKKELLREPPHGAAALGSSVSSARHHAPGLADLLSSGTTWSFNNMQVVTGSGKTAVTHLKRESDSPDDGPAGKRRQHDDGFSHGLTSTANDDTNYFTHRSGDDAGESYNHNIGVIDLTSDIEDSDQEQGFPERQFVPRATNEADSSRLPKQKVPDQPRKFTRGLSPIAPHPKKPPIVHRSKPPVKPLSQKQALSTNSPGPSGHSVFNTRLKSAEARASTSRSMTPLLGSTTNRSEVPGSLGTLSTRLSTPSTRPIKARPFLQEDSSSEDEAPTITRADSLGRLLNRTRRGPSAAEDLAHLQEQSRKMREVAYQNKTTGESESMTTLDNESVHGSGFSLTLNEADDLSFLGVPHQRMMQ